MSQLKVLHIPESFFWNESNCTPVKDPDLDAYAPLFGHLEHLVLLLHYFCDREEIFHRPGPIIDTLWLLCDKLDDDDDDWSDVSCLTEATKIELARRIPSVEFIDY